MNNHPFHRFIALIDFDQTVLGLCDRQTKIAHEIAHVERQLVGQEEQYVQSQRLAIEARKAVDLIELEMKELDQQEKDKKRKLEHLSNYKESRAFQTEIDQLRRAQHDLEESLLHAWHTLEVREREKEECAGKHAENKIKLQAEIEKKQQELASIKGELAIHSHQREEYKKAIPQEWLDKYEAMRLRVADPVVPVEGDTCSACFHELLHQDIMRLTRGALLECKFCFRFLYHKNILNNS